MGMLSKAIAFAEECGITVEKAHLPRIRAVAIPTETRWVIGIDPEAFDTESDAAEAVAHEIGHILTGAVYDYESSERRRMRDERKANRAAHCIMNLIERR